LKICIWPDDTWCELEYVEEYQFLSDDYAVMVVPDTFLEDGEKGVELFVYIYNRKDYQVIK
jgi:hypothetical protein